MTNRPMKLALSAAAASGIMLFAVNPISAQEPRGATGSRSSLVAPRSSLSSQQRFDGLAAGPYQRLVIRNAMVIPGHGGPPAGPYDILIEGNTITQMVPFDPVSSERRGENSRLAGDRVIDAAGKYVMPGMIDLHMHLRTAPMEIDYVYYLKLAHGVTTIVPAPDRGLDSALVHQKASAENRILAPRQYPIWGWGRGFPQAEYENPANAQRIARAMVAQGAHVVSVGNVTWSQELFGAVCKAVWDAGGITTIHLPPSTTAVVNAVDAARLGVTMIEHHYGYAESSLPRSTQNFPRDYNFDNENHRFREAGRVWVEAKENSRNVLLNDVADSLVKYGVTMLPTRVVYEANRDILRAESLPWHEKYTHQALINWNLPNPAYHGSYHYDWTSDDESYWTDAFRLWGDLIYEFNKRGGRVAYGTDDNYIWATPGFSNIRELQLLRETGMHNLEVIKSATLNSAQTLRQPKLGLVAWISGGPAHRRWQSGVQSPVPVLVRRSHAEPRHRDDSDERHRPYDQGRHRHREPEADGARLKKWWPSPNRVCRGRMR